MTSVGISIFHTVFNISNTLLLFPFAKQLVTLSGRIVREKPERLAAAEISMTSVDEDVLERPHMDNLLRSTLNSKRR